MLCVLFDQTVGEKTICANVLQILEDYRLDHISKQSSQSDNWSGHGPFVHEAHTTVSIPMAIPGILVEANFYPCQAVWFVGSLKSILLAAWMLDLFSNGLFYFKPSETMSKNTLEDTISLKANFYLLRFSPFSSGGWYIRLFWQAIFHRFSIAMEIANKWFQSHEQTLHR